MKPILPIAAAALLMSLTYPVFAQGTYYSEGSMVDEVKARVAAYEAGDWDAYKAGFAEDVLFVNNSDSLTLDQRMEEHMAIHQVFENVHFVNTVYGVVENEGETWGLFWGGWRGTVKSTGEEVGLMVHVASLKEDGKVVVEYGFWDTAEVAPIMEAAMSDMSDM